MRICFISFICLFTISPGVAQKSVNQGYYDYLKHKALGDSLYEQRQFEKAAAYYANVNRLKIGHEPINHPASHYNAACCWALAGSTDSAFAQLDLLVKGKGYHNKAQLENDSDLKNLHSDHRWPEVLAGVILNQEAKAVRDKRITVSSTFKSTVFYPLTDQVKGFLNHSELPLISINHGHYRIHFRADSYTAEQIEQVKQQVSHAYSRSLELLHLSEYNRGIHLVFLPSRDEMEALTGRSAGGGFALAGHDCVVFNHHAKKLAPPITHEIFHLISLQTWGGTKHRLLIEGSAVFAQNECDHLVQNPVYAINTYLAREDALFPFKKLISDFDSAVLDREVEAYFQSAGIFKYLYETYGVEKMEKLWKMGFESFENIYGITIETFELQWTQYIRSLKLPKSAQWEEILTQGCQELKVH